MGKYSNYHHAATTDRDRETHPIWRGVGCLLIVLIPALAYAISLWVLEANTQAHWFAVPRELAIRGVSDPLLGAKIALTIAISFVIYMIFSLVTFFANRMFGPSRYGPQDVPPINRRTKRSR